MSPNRPTPAIIFCNQDVGPLFVELMAKAAQASPVALIGTGVGLPAGGPLLCFPTPRYRNDSLSSRLRSWVGFLLIASWRILREGKTPLLVLVSNPPLNPLLGLLARMLRGQKYALLFYDMYPDALIWRGICADDGLIARWWRRLNRCAMARAESVITISSGMAETLRSLAPARQETRVAVVPTWVNTERIRPVPKDQNPFAVQHGQTQKLTVMYSGNIGLVHNLDCLPLVAARLSLHKDIHFIVISEGEGKLNLERQCTARNLDNVTFLPWQDEDALPLSLAASDIALIAVAKGAESITMPSKTYYMMAAGSAVLALSEKSSGVADVVARFDCGVAASPDNIDGVVTAILEMHGDRDLLDRRKHNARRAAEMFFSSRVCVPHLLAAIGHPTD